MKRFRVFYGGLAGLAAACALGAWFAPVGAGWLAFPWGSIGAGLRVLSLSGSVGNVAACGLYAMLCLLTAGIADRKSTRLNSSHSGQSRMPSSA